MDFRGNKLYFSEADQKLCKGLPVEAPVQDVDAYRERVKAQTEAVEHAMLQAQADPIRGNYGDQAQLAGRLIALDVLGKELSDAANYVQNDAVEVELHQIIYRGNLD